MYKLYFPFDIISETLKEGMGVFSIVLLITCVSTIWSARFPRWPEEFRWSSAGSIDGWTCTRILEVADPDTWDDNYFCYRSSPHIRGVGMRWSSAGNYKANSRSSRVGCPIKTLL